jgi:hypothetical protein
VIDEQQSSVKLIAFTVYFSAVNAAATVIMAIRFLLEVVIFLYNTPAVRESMLSPQFAAEIMPLLPNKQLYRRIGIIAETVINIFIKDACPGAERHPPPAIREKGVGVVVQLCDGKRAIENHPVDKIGQLT